MRYSTSNLRSLFVVLTMLGLVGCAGTPGGSRPATPAGSADAMTVVPDDLQQQYDNAQTLISVEDYEGAAQILESLIRQYPQYPAAATTLAICWRHLERADDALALLGNTLAAHDAYAPGWNEVGILHRQSGRFDEAEAAYLKAVTVNPDYALAHLNLGILLDLYLARPDEALMHYERYQSLQATEDKQVGRWIADVSRRVQRTTQAAQAQ